MAQLGRTHFGGISRGFFGASKDCSLCSLVSVHAILEGLSLGTGIVWSVKLVQQGACVGTLALY